MKSRALESGVDVTALIVVGNVIWISGRDGSLQIRHLVRFKIRVPSAVYHLTLLLLIVRTICFSMFPVRTSLSFVFLYVSISACVCL